VIVRVLLPVSVSVIVLAGCKEHRDRPPPPPAITAEWTDDFERAELGPDYKATSDVYALVNGALSAQGAHNRPLWLRRALPRDAVVEVDAWSTSPDGDIKVELYGDGRSYDPDQGGYQSTAYVAVMGGWKNSKSQIARLDEHGKDIVSRTGPRVEKGKRYHWKFVRQGSRLDWFVDDMETPFLTLDDPHPLEGDDHAFFAFDNWETDTWFDNLRIAPASK
jgi:hypothetical protein